MDNNDDSMNNKKQIFAENLPVGIMATMALEQIKLVI